MCFRFSGILKFSIELSFLRKKALKIELFLHKLGAFLKINFVTNRNFLQKKI